MCVCVFECVCVCVGGWVGVYVCDDTLNNTHVQNCIQYKECPLSVYSTTNHRSLLFNY